MKSFFINSVLNSHLRDFTLYIVAEYNQESSLDSLGRLVMRNRKLPVQNSPRLRELNFTFYPEISRWILLVHTSWCTAGGFLFCFLAFTNEDYLTWKKFKTKCFFNDLPKWVLNWLENKVFYLLWRENKNIFPSLSLKLILKKAKLIIMK